MRSRPFATIIAAAYAVAVLALTLTPIAWALNRLTVRLYVVARYDVTGPWSDSVTPQGVGSVLNVVLFVPLGLIIVLLLRRHVLVALLAAVAVSSCVELVQLVPLLHREAELGDVLANATGGFLGGLLGLAVTRRRENLEEH